MPGLSSRQPEYAGQACRTIQWRERTPRAARSRITIARKRCIQCRLERPIRPDLEYRDQQSARVEALRSKRRHRGSAIRPRGRARALILQALIAVDPLLRQSIFEFAGSYG